MSSKGRELKYQDRQREEEFLTPAIAVINQKVWEMFQFQKQIQ